jgi:predicted permease
VAVRTAVGASRGRLVLQLLTEVMVLAVLGGFLGFGLGEAGVRWFEAAVSIDPPPFWITFELDYRVMLFLTAMIFLASLFSGLLPALQASRTDVVDALKDEGRGLSSFRMGRFTGVLVIAEVAFSCCLLVVSGLMIKSIVKLNTINMPFATENIFTARIDLPQLEYPDEAQRIQFYEQLLPKLEAIPGVEAATLSDGLPASGNGTVFFEVEGQVYEQESNIPITREGIVTPGYFRTFRTEVLQGRAFNPMDTSTSLPVAVVNASFARTYYPDGDVLGKRIRKGKRDTEADWLTIVGIVPDMLMQGIGNADASPAGFYIPISQSNVSDTVRIAMRARGRPMERTNDVRAAIASIDPNLPIFNVLSMEREIYRASWPYMVFGTLFMSFGIAALFLAVAGLYGVMSFSVTRRTQEMGIRLALGAPGRRLVRLIMRRGLVHIGIGLALGLGMAALTTGPLQDLLYKVEVQDPLVFLSVVAALALAGILASYIPARRITKIDPMLALTSE